MLIKTRGGISVAFPGRLTIFHQPHPSLRRLTRDARKEAVRVGQYTLQLQMKDAYLTLHPIHRRTTDRLSDEHLFVAMATAATATVQVMAVNTAATRHQLPSC